MLNKVERYRRTPKGVLTNIYAAQKRNSPSRGLGPVEYTLKQLHERFLEDSVFLSLYKVWVDARYNHQLKPSIDRKNPLKPYTLDNVQMLTWKQNHTKAMEEATLTHGKPVMQMDMKGNEIMIFGSIKEAGQKTGICRGNITKACQGHYSQSGGYRWKYLQTKSTLTPTVQSGTLSLL